jgi:hypothetical protein
MADFWMDIWTILWYLGLGVFSGLAVVTIIFGGRDLAMMLASLRQRHMAQQAEEQPPEAPT